MGNLQEDQSLVLSKTLVNSWEGCLNEADTISVPIEADVSFKRLVVEMITQITHAMAYGNMRCYYAQKSSVLQEAIQLLVGQ